MICDRNDETCHTARNAFAFRRASELYFDASENCFIVELVENHTHVQVHDARTCSAVENFSGR